MHDEDPVAEGLSPQPIAAEIGTPAAAETKGRLDSRSLAWIAPYWTAIYRIAVVALLAYIAFKPIVVDGGEILVYTGQSSLSVSGGVSIDRGYLDSVGSVRSVRSVDSVGSVGSVVSVDSVRSVDSVGSVGSVRLVDSVRSVDSVGSVGSVDSVVSVDSVRWVGSVGSVRSVRSVDSVDKVGSVGSVDKVGSVDTVRRLMFGP